MSAIGFLLQPDGSATCCDCGTRVDPCDPCDPTPCDLSVADNSDLGNVSIANITALNSSTSFGVFDVMEFQLEYLDGCFSYDSTYLGNPSTCYTTLGHICTYSGGGLNFNLTQAGSDSCDPPTTGASCSNVAGSTPTLQHRHNGGDVSLKFTGWGGYSTLTRHNGSPNNPRWRLRRTRKFGYTFTAAGQIKNYSTYAAGLWAITYNGLTTAGLAFTATALDVQTALNALANITADGGVTVVGSLASGWTITWNSNGARALVTSTVTTVNIGWRFTVTETTHGDLGTKEVEKVLLEFGCSACASAPGLPEWNGRLTIESITDFDQLNWSATTVPNQGTLKLNEQKLYLVQVRYSTSLSSTTSNGCGYVLTIACMTGGGVFTLIWEGVKGNGTDWIGVYSRITSTDVGDGIMCNTINGPATLEIVAYP